MQVSQKQLENLFQKFLAEARTPATKAKSRKTKKTATKATTPKVIKPTMTATQATTFDSYSVGNAAYLDSILACGCAPYVDIFTFKRWIAQGLVVRKGQKAIKVPVLKSTTTDEETQEVKKLFTTASLFCRHQVKPIAAK